MRIDHGAGRPARGEKGLPPPTVSVIVPVYNNAEGLRRTLDSLQCQSYPEHLREVIVVDNDSTDDTPELSSRYPDVIWLSEPRPGSYGARNVALAEARGQVLAFTDSDCLPAEDWIEQGVRALLGASRAGFVGGRIEVVFRDSQHGLVCELYDSLCSFSQEETLSRFGYAATANLFTNSEVIEAVGVFDHRLRSGGDCEWCNRVVAAGWRPHYGAQAVVRHPARRSLSTLVAKSLRVTVGSMTTSEKGRSRFSWRYVRYHLFSRPNTMLRSLRQAEPAVSWFTAARVLGLYYVIKCLQVAERLRVVAGGTPRR